MAKTAFVLAGQGSQYPGMGKEIYDKYDCVRKIYNTANDILGYDLTEVSFNDNPDKLSKTLYAQPAIFALSLAGYEILKENDVMPDMAAGFSLGEISAAAVCGTVSLEDGFKIVARRAAAMQQAAEKYGGVMYAVIGPKSEDIEEICLSQSGYVRAVNYNAETQTVIAGEPEACESAARILSERFSARTVKLNVSGAFHSALIAPAADIFYDEIKDIKFKAPEIPMYSDVTGERLSEISADYLRKQMISPVRWTTVVKNMIEDGAEEFIELGSGKTLCGLIKKADRKKPCFNIEDTATLNKYMER